MSDNPFGAVGAPAQGSPNQDQFVAAQRGGNTKRFFLFAIGAVLIIAGFVWKFFTGTITSTADASISDFAWLLPVVIGVLLSVAAFRGKRR